MNTRKEFISDLRSESAVLTDTTANKLKRRLAPPPIALFQ